MKTLISWAPFKNLATIQVINIRSKNNEMTELLTAFFVAHANTLTEVDIDDEVLVKLANKMLPGLRNVKVECSETLAVGVTYLLYRHRDLKNIIVNTSKIDIYALGEVCPGGETLFPAFDDYGLPPWDKLSSLNLSNCRNMFNDRTLQIVLPYLKQLRLLAFSHCHDLGQLGVTGTDERGGGTRIRLDSLTSMVTSVYSFWYSCGKEISMHCRSGAAKHC